MSRHMQSLTGNCPGSGRNFEHCTDIYVGWPGSVHDAHVFANSSVVEKIEKGQLLCVDVRNGICPFMRLIFK